MVALGQQPLVRTPGEEPLRLVVLVLEVTLEVAAAPDAEVHEAAGAQQAVEDEVEALAVAWRGTGRRVVAVTNEVGQGVVPETSAGRRFRDQMGRLNARLAAETEDVRWCAAGRVLPL